MRISWNGITATRRLVLGILGVMVLCGAQGCEGPTAPEETESVRIVLGVSGGIAGVNWQLTIDGGRAEIVGDRCRALLGCDWEAGEVLAATDATQLLELARRFHETGFLELSQTDFGTECCDQFSYELTYAEADDRRTVLGSDSTLPTSVLDLVGEVQQFVNEARAGG
jgi:hypothetical protein